MGERMINRTHWRGPVLALLAWALVLSAAAPCPARETFRISYSPGAAIHVLARERLKEVYDRAGFDVEFVPMPHKRSIQCAADGVVDGETGRIKGLENRFPGLIRVDVKLVDLTGGAYVTGDSPITRYDTGLLDSVRVGAIKGVQWSERELADRRAEMVGEYTQLLGMLVEGRVDMVLGSTLSVEAALREDAAHDRPVRRLEPLVFCSALYHYVNEKNARIVPLLEKALRELWAEGRWDADGYCSAATGD